MRILVTGSAGFIGTAVLKDARERGIEVKTMDLPHSILDEDCLSDKMDGVQAVIHLAAIPGVLDSLAHPYQNFRTNVEGTHNVLGCAYTQGIQRVVFASSAAADDPRSPYGASKASGEAYCKAYAESYQMQTVIARLSNVYGPHSRHKKTAVVRFINQALAGEPLTIYGDGEQLRDFVWVEDVARKLVNLTILTDAPKVGPHYIGRGYQTTINGLAALIEKIRGSDLARDYHPGRSGEIVNPKLFPIDDTMIPLRDGLQLTYDWFKAVVNNEKEAV